MTSASWRIDGTWRRDCLLNAISDTDAILTVEGSIQGLNLKEFFLLLSSTGLAYRRCELVRVNGTEMDIRFLRGKQAKKKLGRLVKEGRGDAPEAAPACRSALSDMPAHGCSHDPERRLFAATASVRADLARCKHDLTSRWNWRSGLPARSPFRVGDRRVLR